MEIATALTKAIAAHKMRSRVEGICVSLYRGSDFINLTKLTALMLQIVREKNAEIELKKTNIWEMDLEYIERHRRVDILLREI